VNLHKHKVITIEYEASGEKIKAKPHGFPARPKVGDVLKIKYNPRNKKQYYVLTYSPIYIFLAMILVLFLGILSVVSTISLVDTLIG
jgi:hypothetical protein